METPKKKEDNIVPQIWTPELEELLAEWSEKASCYRWLHGKSEKAYRFRNYLFTIPVIILSTLTGTANFAIDSFVPDGQKQMAMAVVGSVNIFAGILTTLQNFLRYAELMESHRSSTVSWSKFGRDISIELALDPNRRKPSLDFLKVCRAEYDRLIEQSPTIDESIISRFKKVFKSVDIRKPEVCNGLHRCKVYEISEDERMANIMVQASQKLIKPVKKWTVKQTPSTNPRQESMEEISALNSMSVVSQFKKKISEKPVNDEPNITVDIEDVVIPDRDTIVEDDKEDDEEEDEKIDEENETDEILDGVK